MRLSDKKNMRVCLRGPLGFPGEPRASRKNTAVFSASCHFLLLCLYIYIPLLLCHLSILIADVLPHDGGIKLSVLISTAFHHLECRCLINWLVNQTKHRGEREAVCSVLKKYCTRLTKTPRGSFCALYSIHSASGHFYGIKYQFSSSEGLLPRDHSRQSRSTHRLLGGGLYFSLAMRDNSCCISYPVQLGLRDTVDRETRRDSEIYAEIGD